MSGMFAVLALAAGAAIATQATMNARLGVLLGSSTLGMSFAFLSSSLVCLGILAAVPREWPSVEALRAVPRVLWFGGVLSAFGVGMLYYLIPRMGAGPMMSLALTGQIVVAVVASHFGWFELPAQPVNAVHACGLTALIVGVVLLNWEWTV